MAPTTPSDGTAKTVIVVPDGSPVDQGEKNGLKRPASSGGLSASKPPPAKKPKPTFEDKAKTADRESKLIGNAVERLKATIKMGKDEIAKLKQELAAKNAELELKNQRLRETTNRPQEENDRIQKLEQANGCLQAEIKLLRDEKKHVCGGGKWEEECFKLQKENQKLEDAVDKLEGERKELEDDRDKLTEVHKKLENDMAKIRSCFGQLPQ
ncbi:hypothetical protein PG988_004466 [Apiospora saccharicola]